MAGTKFTTEEIRTLAQSALVRAFKNVVNAAPLARSNMLVECDGVHSHGLCICWENGMAMTTRDLVAFGFELAVMDFVDQPISS